MRRVILVAVGAAVALSCKGSGPTPKLTRSTFDPGLAQVPQNVPDKEPPRRIGDAYTVYGLWAATQDPEQEARIKDTDVKVRGYVVHVSKPAGVGGMAVTPLVWLADQPTRKGFHQVVTGFGDSYVALEDAAAWDACIEACKREKGDPMAEADRTPGRWSPTFGECVKDVRECRDLYETNPRANYFETMGGILKWYVRDQIFGSERRRQIEDELRAAGNIICEAGPAQRRLMVTILVANVLHFDLDKFRRDVGQEIKEKYGGQRADQLEPSILQGISNRNLVVLDDPEGVKKVMDAIRAIRAGTDDGSALGTNRRLGAEWRAALAKGGTQGARGVVTDARKVATDLLDDLMYRWFWSKADTRREANQACVFDDLIDLTSDRLEPIKLLARRRAMLGPTPDVTWDDAMRSAQPVDLTARFTPQSRTGFLGWTLDILPSMVCAVKTNCPEYINPLFGTVYDYDFGTPPASP